VQKYSDEIIFLARLAIQKINFLGPTLHAEELAQESLASLGSLSEPSMPLQESQSDMKIGVSQYCVFSAGQERVPVH